MKKSHFLCRTPYFSKLQGDTEGHDEWEPRSTNGGTNDNSQQYTNSPQRTKGMHLATSSEGGDTTSSEGGHQRAQSGTNAPIGRPHTKQNNRHDHNSMTQSAPQHFASHCEDKPTRSNTGNEHIIQGTEGRRTPTRDSPTPTHQVQHRKTRRANAVTTNPTGSVYSTRWNTKLNKHWQLWTKTPAR